jgi:hypothetical protein
LFGENLALDIELMMSVKKFFLEGSSSIAKIVVKLSDYELTLISQTPIYPLDEEKRKLSDLIG